MSVRTKRMIWLDQLKAISIYIVILGHSLLKFKKHKLFKFIYSFHMPLFFIISGMTFRPEKYNRIKDCVKDKFIKLVYPYIALNILALPLWYINVKTGMIPYDSPFRLLIGILYSNSSVARAPSNATWFLMTLFCAEVIYYMIYRYFKTDNNIFMVSCILAIIGVIAPLGKEFYDAPFHLDVSLVAQFFYGCGYLLKKNFNYFKNCFKEYTTVKIIFIFTVGVFFGIINKQVDMSNELYRNITYTLITSISLSFLLIYIVQGLRFSNKMLIYIGQNTIIILALHIPLLRVLQALFPIFMKNQIYAILASLIVFVLMVPTVWIVNKVFKMFVKMPKTLKTQIEKI